MNSDRTLRKIFNTKPDGGRSVGRPKLRWEVGVDQDMRIGRKSPSTETNGHSFLRRPGPTGAVNPMIMVYGITHARVYV
jgi:hypothetical protein